MLITLLLILLRQNDLLNLIFEVHNYLQWSLNFLQFRLKWEASQVQQFCRLEAETS